MYGCVLNGKPLHKIVLHVWSSVFQSYLNAIHTLAKFSVCICIPKQKKTYKVCVCCILWYKSMSIVWIHFAEVACGRCFAKIAIFNEAFMFACLLNVCPILSLMKSGKKKWRWTTCHHFPPTLCLLSLLWPHPSLFLPTQTPLYFTLFLPFQATHSFTVAA